MTKQAQKMEMNTVEQVTSRSNRRPFNTTLDMMVSKLGTFQITRNMDNRIYKIVGRLTDGTAVVLRKSDADTTMFNEISALYVVLTAIEETK